MRLDVLRATLNLEAAADGWWKRLSQAKRRTYIEAHPESKYGQLHRRYTLPPEPGTAPIPDGHVRLYHQTNGWNLRGIRKNGLQFAKARGIEGPRAIYADTEGFYGKPSDTPTVEFHVPKERFSRPFVLGGDVEPESIIGVHRPWHRHARYIEEHPQVMDNLLSGQHDSLIKDDHDFGHAVSFIKHKYGMSGDHIPETSAVKINLPKPIKPPKQEFGTPLTKGKLQDCESNSKREYYAHKKLGKNPKYIMGHIIGEDQTGWKSSSTYKGGRIGHAWVEVDGKIHESTPFNSPWKHVTYHKEKELTPAEIKKIHN